MGTDTKKDGHTGVEIHYNMAHHEQRLVEGGLARVAGQSCLAGPSVLRLHPRFGHRPGWVYGRELRPESQAFLCGATNSLHTAGYEPRGGLAPTCIVPGALAAPSPVDCNISFCVSTASAGIRIKA